jgi:FtsH-binding integral membrane protein
MSNRFDDQPVLRTSVRSDIDVGLRNHMLKVYNYMAAGLTITGLVAFLLSTQASIMQAIFGTPLQYLFMFAPFVVVLIFSAKIHKLSAPQAQSVFLTYSALMGISLSWIFLAYTGQSIAQVFFVSASMFGFMSLFGYTTKRDLSQMGSFLIMGLWGVIAASLVNLFMKSGTMSLVISIIAVIIFTGLTAYDTQMIKEVYEENDSGDTASKKAIMGALTLYLDFINLFIHLLRILGDRR